MVVGILGGMAGILAFACTPDTAPVAAGGECFTASDCAPGLVCVPQRGGARQCSDDLTMVVGRPPAEASAAEAGDGPTEGQATDSAGQDTAIPDTSVPDTSKPDAAEAG